MSLFSRFFKPASLLTAGSNRKAVFETLLKQHGLGKMVSSDVLKDTTSTARVYCNAKYFPKSLLAHDAYSLPRLLDKVALVSVAGDKGSMSQEGALLSQDFFKSLKPGDSKGLACEERLLSTKKIQASVSLAFKQGGYPQFNPQEDVTPFDVGIFSLPGQQFEMDYLQYRLFFMDPKRPVIGLDSFEHYYADTPTDYHDALKVLEAKPQEITHNSKPVSLVYPGLFPLRHSNVLGFHGGPLGGSPVIFNHFAYQKAVDEDVLLLLNAVNDLAQEVGKKAFLKATGVGMGLFAKVDGCYDMSHHLYPMYLRAYRRALETHEWPHIGCIEFPLFHCLPMLFSSIFSEKNYRGVDVMDSRRDVLAFRDEEKERYFPCVVNPSDSNAVPGNEWVLQSVEALLGMNTTLRVDQSPLNPVIMDEHNHHRLDLGPGSNCLIIKQYAFS